MIPLRLGVDQVTSERVAVAIGLGPAIGTTVSLIRTGRMMVWAAVGLALLTRRSLGRQARGRRPKLRPKADGPPSTSPGVRPCARAIVNSSV